MSTAIHSVLDGLAALLEPLRASMSLKYLAAYGGDWDAFANAVDAQCPGLVLFLSGVEWPTLDASLSICKMQVTVDVVLFSNSEAGGVHGRGRGFGTDPGLWAMQEAVRQALLGQRIEGLVGCAGTTSDRIVLGKAQPKELAEGLTLWTVPVVVGTPVLE